jgi:uncharacterized membrane protein YfhO
MKALLITALISLTVFPSWAQEKLILKSHSLQQDYDLTDRDLITDIRFKKDIQLIEHIGPKVNTDLNKAPKVLLQTHNRTFELNSNNLSYLRAMFNDACAFWNKDLTLMQKGYPLELARVNAEEQSYAVLSISDRIGQVQYSYYIDLATLDRLTFELNNLNTSMGRLAKHKLSPF